MPTAEELEKLRKSRTSKRAGVTRYINKIKDDLTRTVICVGDVQRNLRHLATKESELKELDEKIYELTPVADLDVELEAVQTYEDNISDCRDEAEKALDAITTIPASSSTNVTQHALTTNPNASGPPSVASQSQNSATVPFQSTTQGQGSITASATQPNPQVMQSQQVTVKLPRLNIEKYYGDCSKWLNFWNQFEVSIHQNNALTKVDKFNYLKSYLGGLAATAVGGLSLTETNYDKAIVTLEERFGGVEGITDAHMNNIMDLTPVRRKGDTVALRTFYDSCIVEVRSLESLGKSLDDGFLHKIITKLLPYELALDYSRQIHGTNQRKVQDLLEFIRKELESRERALAFTRLNERTEQSSDKEYRTFQRNRESQLPRKKPFSSAMLSNGVELTCPFCEASHSAEECKAKSLEERLEVLKKDRKCFRCMKSDHMSRRCKAKIQCKHCQRRHHTAMCETREKEEKEKTLAKTEESANNTIVQNEPPSPSSQVLLQTATVILKGEKNQAPTRCLIDGGSQRTFIRKDLSERLALPEVGAVQLNYFPFGAKKPTTILTRRVKLTVESIHGESSIEIEATESPEISAAKIQVPSKEIVKHFKENELNLAEDIEGRFTNQGELGLLIGADYYWKVFNMNSKRLSDSLVAMESLFGWILQGPTSASCLLMTTELEEQTGSVNLIMETSPNDDIGDSLRLFWELDSSGLAEMGEKTMDDREKEAVSKFESTVKLKDGRYQVNLPWTEDKNKLGNNRKMAEKRLQGLGKRFRKDFNLFEKYKSVIEEYEARSIIERVPNDEIETESAVYYMPHQPVVNTERETTKLRVVFDASSHEGNALSLNEVLLPGPNLIPELFDILIKFRMHKVALTADIEQAFLQISIASDDRDALRFLWQPEPFALPAREEPTIYRMTRVVFGLTSSPYHLGATVKWHARKHEREFPETCQRLNHDMFVDDFISGEDNDDSAYQRAQEARIIMSSAKMTLRKWRTSSSEVRKRIQRENWEPTPNSEKPIAKNALKSQMVLGVVWNDKNDTFGYQVDALIKSIPELNETKRSLLKSAAKIFDPLGLLSPFTIRVKIMFQELWLVRKDWDDPLPEHVSKAWKSWLSELPDLNLISTPRHCLADLGEAEIKTRELHCFCDASEAAYGASVYSRVESHEGEITTLLIAAKTRVAPIKKLSVPLLELNAALVGAKLTNRINKMFKPTNEKMQFWSDSQTVIKWIHGISRKWKPMVANRVEEIQNMTEPDSWNYCKGKENPSDFLTRGQKVVELVNNLSWWRGPFWLSKKREEWPDRQAKELEPEEEIEYKAQMRKNFLDCSQFVVKVNEDSEKKILDLANYSTLQFPVGVHAQMRRFAYAWVNKFVRKGGELESEKFQTPLTAEERQSSKEYFIRRAQRNAFSQEIEHLKQQGQLSQDSVIKQLNPFLDNSGILRVGGRLQLSELSYSEKHPIILPKKNELTDLIIDEAHLKVYHQGLANTLAQVREIYWIPQGRQQVKNRISQCLKCKSWKVKALAEETATLPMDRISKAASFEVTGVDFAGPLYLKKHIKEVQERGSSKSKAKEKIKVTTCTYKAYICLFTCGVTRAIHLELITEMSTETFLQALRRFIARRGLVRVIYSDNALSFKKADKNLISIWKNIKKPEVYKYFGTQGITWKFIAERSPWWGGFYERQVQTVKIALKKTLGKAMLDFEEMQTVVTEVEAVVNSRPLTYQYSEADEPTCLTPAHFLVGRRLTSLPPNSNFNPTSTISSKQAVKRWKYKETLLNKFWRQWKREYLLLLNSAHNVDLTKRGTIKPGDVMLVNDSDLPRQQWQIARVEEVFDGRDSKIRACSLKLPNQKVIKRSINLLHPLELE